MQHLDITKKESGKIWHRKPSASYEDGVIVKIRHGSSGPSLSHTHNIRFLHATFDTSGDRFLTGDHQGNLIVFDLTRNRFQLVQKTGKSCTSLAFKLRRKTEILATFSDYSIKCYDIDTKELVSWMKGHKTAVHSISVHGSGRYAITTSSDAALLWDLDTFTRKRKLNVKDNVEIVKVFFLPLSNTIITCFKDDSIFAWESDTLKCKYQLPVPDGQRPQYKSFATTRDGRILVAAGKSRFLHVWCLDTQSLIRVIELPTKVHVVKQLQFLPESFDGGSGQVVGVLSQDGIMRFMNIFSCRLEFDIGSLEDRILNVDISPSGRHIVAVVESGCLNLYCVSALTAERNKPPPPLVKMVTKKGQKGQMRSLIQPQTGGRLRSKTLKTEEPRLPMDLAPVKDDSEDDVTGLPEGLDMNRLKAILKGYGEYPAKYRMFIWRSVLRLPENHTAFSSLVDKGTHVAWSKVHEDYPIKSRKLLRVLQRTLSALAHWSIVFGETNYLPVLAFPFIKLFQNNQLVCFEIIATVIMNWCQHWFEFFPNPPVNVLSAVENLLAHHDKALLQHFVKLGITTQVYAWPIMETLFSEIVTKDEWLRLWDNIFTNHPSFMLHIVAAYLICSRLPLINCFELSDFEYFFHHRNPVDISAVLKTAYELQDTTPDEINPANVMEDFKPLTRGQYPVFNKYPQFIVDFQAQEREQIRQDELDYLHQRQIATEIKQQAELRQKKEEAWYHQQELLQEAEEERRRNMMAEEQKLADQRLRLQAMKRELCMRELQVLDATRMRFMDHQEKQRGTQLKRLDDEVMRKSLLREQETQSAVADVEIKSMELEIQKERLQQELAKESSMVDFREKLDYDTHRRQNDLEDKVIKKAWQSNQLDHQHDKTNSQWRLALADQQKADKEFKNEIKLRTTLDDIDRKLHQLQINTLQAKSANEEEFIWDKVEELRREKELITEMLNEKNIRKEYAKVPETQVYSESLPEQAKELSLNRGRLAFAERERDLLQQVHELRTKIASDKSRRQPHINLQYTSGS